MGLNFGGSLFGNTQDSVVYDEDGNPIVISSGVLQSSVQANVGITGTVPISAASTLNTAEQGTIPISVASTLNVAEQNTVDVAIDNVGVSSDEKLEVEGAADFAGRNNTQIRARAGSTGISSATIYTVPANKVFYCTHIHITYMSSAAGNVSYMIIAGGSNWFTWETWSITEQHASIPLSMPYKFTAAQTIAIHTYVANSYATVLILGWLEDA